MKNGLLSLFLMVGVLGAEEKGEGPLAAGLPKMMSVEKLEAEGFQSLFNGKSLDGWRKTGGTGEFEAKDGMIRGFGENIRGNTFLRTEKEYGDFVFAFEFKFVDRSGNSGCMFRGFHKDGEPDGRVTGYQCEHDQFRNGERAWTAGIFDEARRGWLFPPKNASAEEKAEFTKQGERLFKWDEWNLVVIRCRGNHLETWLNGEKRADFKDVDEENVTLKGFFGLQVHGGKAADVLWRNLLIKEL